MSLADFQPRHEFFVGVDSDGCVFDSMELKHKECFIPAFIRRFGLQGVSRYAREAAEFVNLYSKSRGCNRFPGLIAQLDLLRRRPEPAERGIAVPQLDGVRRWLAEEPRPSNPALEAALARSSDADLALTLAWSHEVNERVAAMGANVPPFASARPSLAALAQRCDVLVVSATPQAALDHEWAAHGLREFVSLICGQELGAKKDLLAVAKPYAPQHRLMIGDAPGDYAAAKANECLFFPINPGDEEASWRRLQEEGIRKFFTGEFAGDYQRQLLVEFDALLPADPPWRKNRS